MKSFQSNSKVKILEFYVKMDFIDNDEFYGLLENELVIVNNIKVGQPFKVNQDLIKGWVITDKRTGKMEGDCLSKILLNHAN